MAADTLKSTSITNADASPVTENTRGTGATAYSYTIEDTVVCTATGIATLASTYRMVRVPSNAKIKSVVIATDKALDSHSSSTLAFDVNVAFSDSTTDGTQAQYQGLIPTTAGNATTTVASYSSPNKLYGTVTPSSNTAAYGPTDVVFNGVTSTYPLATIFNTELWSLFGFQNPYGVAQDTGGNFDILLYVSTAATTGVAGTIFTRLTYVV
jgi:hypothetical protein